MPIPNPVVLVRFVEDAEVGRHSLLLTRAGQADLSSERNTDPGQDQEPSADGLVPSPRPT
jgi:hypothetical protein